MNTKFTEITDLNYLLIVYFISIQIRIQQSSLIRVSRTKNALIECDPK